jgi:hypothetical protein
VSFDEMYGIDLLSVAQAFARMSPDPKVREASKTMRIS